MRGESDEKLSAAAGPGGAIAILDGSVAPATPESAPGDAPRDASEEVLASIRRALNGLPSDGFVSLRCAGDPTPLIEVLAAQGWCVDGVVRASRKRVSLEVRRGGAPEVMDLLDLEAPEPLQRILEAAAELAPGEALVARTPCYPRPLLTLLERRGLLWSACERADGSGLVHVRRPG